MLRYDKQMEFAVVKYEKEKPFMVEPLICSWTYNDADDIEKLLVYYDDKQLNNVILSMLMQIEMLSADLDTMKSHEKYTALYKEFETKLLILLIKDGIYDSDK